MARKSSSKPAPSTATIGFEARLWLTADKLRNNMDAAEPSGARQHARQGSPQGQRGGAEQYKHVVLGIIFLKYISDTFRRDLHPDPAQRDRALIDADLVDCMVAAGPPPRHQCQ